MLIDEINRGYTSKIFGELITLIEIDKRERITVELAYSGDLFTVPKNVDIVGTMNTADRSLALVDTALRRRFWFEPIYPDTSDAVDAPLHGLTVEHENQRIDIRRMLETINQRIEALYDRDHMIGHSFFMPLSDVVDQKERFERLGKIFKRQIIPLLEEYFFEDWEKMRLVLGDNQKLGDARFIIRSGEGDDDLVKLFGQKHGLEESEVKVRFKLNSQAFDRPAAYIGIYLTDTSG
jgi:5-methylcytosine-specific restriction enzyme B